MDADFYEALIILRALVDTARPAFPKTPYREALERAKALLARLEKNK